MSGINLFGVSKCSSQYSDLFILIYQQHLTQDENFIFLEIIPLLGFLDIALSWFSYLIGCFFSICLTSFSLLPWFVNIGVSQGWVLDPFFIRTPSLVVRSFLPNFLSPALDPCLISKLLYATATAYSKPPIGCWINISYLTCPKPNSHFSSPNLLPPTVFDISLDGNCICPVAQAKD